MKTTRLAIVAGLTAVIASMPLVAQFDDEDPVVSYRQSYMSSIGGHVGSVHHLLSNGLDFEGDLLMHAEALAKLTANIARLFPEGSTGGETSAKPAVWAEWDTFVERADANSEAADALLAAARSEDDAAVKEAFRALGKSCRACHDDYREKD